MDRYDVGGRRRRSGRAQRCGRPRALTAQRAGRRRGGAAQRAGGRGAQPAGQEGRPPAELLAPAATSSGRTAAASSTGTAVGARRAAHGDFEVELDDGRTVGARRLLVATGLVDELPDVPGVRELWGTDVLHCPYCHGYEAADQAVGVLATSPLGHARGAALAPADRRRDGLPAERGPAEATTTSSASPPATSPPCRRGGCLETTDGRLSACASRTAPSSRGGTSSWRRASRPVACCRPRARAGGAAHGRHRGRHGRPAGPDGATAVPGVHVAGNVADLRSQVVTSAARA
jgi:hypothetical protein